MPLMSRFFHLSVLLGRDGLLILPYIDHAFDCLPVAQLSRQDGWRHSRTIVSRSDFSSEFLLSLHHFFCAVTDSYIIPPDHDLAARLECFSFITIWS
jgi:hypothetical protein